MVFWKVKFLGARAGCVELRCAPVLYHAKNKRGKGTKPFASLAHVLIKLNPREGCKRKSFTKRSGVKIEAGSLARPPVAYSPQTIIQRKAEGTRPKALNDQRYFNPGLYNDYLLDLVFRKLKFLGTRYDVSFGPRGSLFVCLAGQTKELKQTNPSLAQIFY